MKIIYNKYIPFGRFWATNLFGFVFCRVDKGKLTEKAKNHEYIHSLQQRELGYIGFMILYNLEWICRFAMCRNFMKAYRALTFEREAYDNEANLDYAAQRSTFAWWRYYSEGSLMNEVGRFVKDLRDFVKDDFTLPKYLFALLTAVALMVAQVYFDFYNVFLHPAYDYGLSWIVLPAVQVAVYLFVLVGTLALGGELWRLRQWQAWVLPTVLVAAGGAGQGFDAYNGWIREAALPLNESHYLRIVGSFLFRSVFVLSSICLFRWLTTQRFGLYGLRRSTQYLRTYGLIYALLLPIFVIFSFTPQFLDYYPRMQLDRCVGAFGWDNCRLISVFELCYGNDFLAVESLFRGALVIGLTRWLGPRAVLPMALTYMSIHLGKPDMEMLSSVFGGYILGILAYRTQHLWGGIIIHLGIAMLFEFLGLLR